MASNERARGRIKETPDDFVVEEIPAYEPSGVGGHLYVRFTKTNVPTDQAARAIGNALGVAPRDVGIAGLKDKVGVTTQTISLAIPPHAPSGGDDLVARAKDLALDGIVVRAVSRHGNKLKTGHLAGNRFAIRVRGIDRARVGEVTAALSAIGRDGLPNAFGVQRFGRDGDNADRARRWLTGAEPPPRDGRLQRLLFSAWQSEAFNAVLAARVDDGTWATPLVGDLVKRRSTGDDRRGGGMFLCTDVQVDRERAARGELSPTGPIFGVKMRDPEGAPRALERAVLARLGGDKIDLERAKRLGEGTRRALRLWVDELRVEANAAEDGREGDASIRVYFVLPKGAYATTVLGAVFDLDDASRPPRRAAGDDQARGDDGHDDDDDRDDKKPSDPADDDSDDGPR